MINQEAKRIVSAGLERRKDARRIAEREAWLERYEQEQIQTCNEHYEDAKRLRDAELATQLKLMEAEARRAARAQALAKEQAREDAATAAVRYYILACLGLLWLTAFTHLPIWAAVTTDLGLAVFPAAYIYRLYFLVKQ